MEWKRIKQRYGTDPYYLYLNKLHVVTVAWDLFRSKTSETSYRVDVHLPGMRDNFTTSRHTSEQAAKDYAEEVVKRWVDAAGLEFKLLNESIKWDFNFNFYDGATIEKTNQVVDGYRWCGILPKCVPPGSTPETSGGIGPDAWVYVSEWDGVKRG